MLKRKIKTWAGLPPQLLEEIIHVLVSFKVIITCGPKDMLGVNILVNCDHLSVLSGSKLVRQKKKHLSRMREEWLASVRHIREVEYPELLANVFLAPKLPTFMICIDYTDLIKACHIDPFHLSSLDQMANKTSGCELLSFIDAFKGYHQIFMALEDQEKIAFQTPRGLFSHIFLAFELRNLGSLNNDCQPIV